MTAIFSANRACLRSQFVTLDTVDGTGGNAVPEGQLLIPVEQIEKAILLIRGQKVMLSSDLASLYGVAPRALAQAVKRNRLRFPEDFMFQLDRHEFENLKSQFVTSSWGGIRKPPYAFTEQGVAMLS